MESNEAWDAAIAELHAKQMARREAYMRGTRHIAVWAGLMLVALCGVYRVMRVAGWEHVAHVLAYVEVTGLVMVLMMIGARLAMHPKKPE